MLSYRLAIYHAILLGTLGLASSLPVRSQVFELEKERMQLAEMHGLWRFHTGDDLRWAAPNFDDSSWPLLRSDQDWAQQGYRGYSGIGWYRFKVLVPPKQRHLSLLLPSVLTSYQVFANGSLVGQFGGMPPEQRVVQGFMQIYSIQSDTTAPGDSISIAIRVWLWPQQAKIGFGGGPSVAPLIGDTDLVRAKRSDAHKAVFWFLTSNNYLLLIYLLSGIAGMALFLLRPAEREYLWFGAYELANAAYLGFWDYQPFYVHSDRFFQIVSQSFNLIPLFFFLIFIHRLLGGHRNGLFWGAIAAIIVSFAGPGLVAMGSYYWAVWLNFAILPWFVCILALLYRGSRRGVPDALLLLGPMLLNFVASLLAFIFLVVGYSGNTEILRFDQWFFRLSEWPFPFSVQNITDLLVQLSILAILLLRFARVRRDEQRMATELESARTVQTLLIPTKIPAILGFTIANVYKPASRVGGDFFHILDVKNGGLLVVIGDVSGKGMPAAMTVSLLVGTVSTLVHYTQSPGEILAAMNLRLLTRSAGGFTTCLVLRIDPDGALTIANAGHLAPYRNGIELSLVNGLPLGLDAASNYTEVKLPLGESETLTLLTDGVVEARNKRGDLFGFERTAAIASNSGEEIAKAAQDFGQEDDITVLTVTRVAVGQSPIEGESTPSLVPSVA